MTDSNAPDIVFRLNTDNGGTGDAFDVHAFSLRGWHWINEHAERPFRFSERTHATVPQRDAYAAAMKPATDAGLRIRIDCGVTPELPVFLCGCGRPYHGRVCAFPPLVDGTEG